MQKQQKILIIEDDGFLLSMYSTKLEMEGYKIIVASDGEKAVRIIKKDPPDLILLDLLLPKMDGFEVLKIIKQELKLKNVPVVILTNLGQKNDIDRCYELGADDYLIKAHFIPSEVISKLKKILEKF